MENMEGDSGMGGFYHLSGKEPKHKGHEVHKGKKSLDFTGFSFVAFVTFVFKKNLKSAPSALVRVP